MEPKMKSSPPGTPETRTRDEHCNCGGTCGMPKAGATSADTGGGCCCGGGAGSALKRNLVIVAVMVGLVAFYILAGGGKSTCGAGGGSPGAVAGQPTAAPANVAITSVAAEAAAKPATGAGLPKLLDLGADKCAPK